MNNKKYMTSQFVKKWLPDFKTKWVEWYNDLMDRMYSGDCPEVFTYEDFDGDLDERFINNYFQEALENFAKAQREECADGFYNLVMNKEVEYTTMYVTIKNVPMPEPIKPQQP